jgi:hypothetical protein
LALGYTGNGSFTFNPVTLSDGNATSADSYGGGSVSSAVSYNPTAGSSGFQAFNGLSSANGNWTLFFADLSGGDGANVTTLNGWTLDITAVPEPVNVALGVFAALLLAWGGLRRAWWVKSSPLGANECHVLPPPSARIKH